MQVAAVWPGSAGNGCFLRGPLKQFEHMRRWQEKQCLLSVRGGRTPFSKRTWRQPWQTMGSCVTLGSCTLPKEKVTALRTTEGERARRAGAGRPPARRPLSTFTACALRAIGSTERAREEEPERLRGRPRVSSVCLPRTGVASLWRL